MDTWRDSWLPRAGRNPVRVYSGMTSVQLTEKKKKVDKSDADEWYMATRGQM